MDEYLEITIQFSLLVLFGISFPLAYFIAFVWNISELQTDKMKLMKFTQRPIPISEASIGSWIAILELSVYVCLLSNAAMVTYTAVRAGEWFPLGGLGLFMCCLFLNFLIQFMLSELFGEMPYRIEIILKRQQYLLKCTYD